MNKLTFLGTGNARNLERHLTSLCFQIVGHNFLIDCGDGMGTLRQLVKTKTSISSINNIFITHRHADHISGLVHFLLIKSFEEKKTVNIYGPKEALQLIEYFCFKSHDNLDKRQVKFNFLPIESDQVISLNSQIKVTSVLVKGPNDSSVVCYAYIVETNKKKIAFTGDMQPDQKFDSVSKNADILIHECFGLSQNEVIIHSKGHSSAKDAGMAAQNAQVRHLILTHLGMKKDIGNGDILINEAKKYFSGKISIAEDLMRVIL